MSRKRRHKNRHDDDAAETVEVATSGIDATTENDVERTEEASTRAPADPPPEEDASGLEAVDREERTIRAESAEELGRLLEDARAEAGEMRALAQRKQAEFENFRKRTERERAETFKYASADVLKEMLPVLDNLERAVEAAKSTEPEAETQLREGVEIICKQFRDTLMKLGLAEVEAQGEPFDPHVHEAVGRVETSEHPEGTVVEVLQKGYWFKDRLLRPSMVSVSLPAGGESSQEESEDEAVRHGE